MTDSIMAAIIASLITGTLSILTILLSNSKNQALTEQKLADYMVRKEEKDDMVVETFNVQMDSMKKEFNSLKDHVHIHNGYMLRTQKLETGQAMLELRADSNEARLKCLEAKQ